MSRGDRLHLLGGGLAGAAAVALSWRIAAGARIRGEPEVLLVAIGAWWVAFAVGAACLLRAPRRWALAIVLVGAVAMRVAGLAGVPALSNDLDRYAWDGRVQAAGIDPYRHAPVAPELAGVREPWLFPDAATCRSIDRPPGCVRINRPHARTIYPPVAQAWFLGVHEVVGTQARELGWQLAGLAVDLALLAVLLAVLRAWGRDPRYVVLYAWCPVAALEAVQNGHVDALATLLAVCALWALRRRPALAGGLLGAATLVKLYPAVLAVLLLRRGWRGALAAFAGVVVAGYLPHVIAVGPDVLGYLPGYLREEDYAGGGRFLLLGALGLGGTAATAVAALILAGVAATVVARRDALAPDAAARRLLGALLLVATPVQTWYALPLVAVAALGGAWWWLAVAAAAYPLFFRALEGVPLPELAAFEVGRLAYGVGLAMVAVGSVLAARRRSVRMAA